MNSKITLLLEENYDKKLVSTRKSFNYNFELSISHIKVIPQLRDYLIRVLSNNLIC